MIHFACQRCGHRVRVDDTWAGMRGRCPSCGTHIDIPDLPGNGAEARRSSPALDALAAAVGRPDDATGAAEQPVPPPPAAVQPARDDITISARQKDPSSETDILPVEQLDAVARQDRRQDGSQVAEQIADWVAKSANYVADKKARQQQRRRTLITLIVTAALFALAVAASLLYIFS